VFGVVGTMANDRFEDIQRSCGSVRCVDSGLNESIERGRLYDNIANGGLGVGVIGVVLAGVLFAAYGVTSSSSEPEPAAVRTGLWVDVTPDSGSVGLSAHF
jgi:hypothetical protein